MKLALNLTFEDGVKVVEAMKNVAIENGWNAEELDECGVIEEYSSVVDAALTAMGINICIDHNPSCEDEDEDENFDEEDCNLDFDDEEDEEDDEDEEDEDEDEDEDDDDEELPSDEEVMNLIIRVLYGQ